MSAIGATKAMQPAVNETSIIRAQCEVNGMNRDCRVMDINEKGLFVESFIPAITNSKVNLSFRLPNGHHVTTSGVVIAHQFKAGFNVDFVGLSMKDQEQITNFVCS
jgi:hypothetical protein